MEEDGSFENMPKKEAVLLSNQRLTTKNEPDLNASSWITSLTCGFVPTNNTFPPSATI